MPSQKDFLRGLEQIEKAVAEARNGTSKNQPADQVDKEIFREFRRSTISALDYLDPAYYLKLETTPKAGYDYIPDYD